MTVFSTTDFQGISGMDYQAAAVKLTRYKDRGYLESPKRGVYYLSDQAPDDWELANYLYRPSYISLDTALSHYGLIPEVVYVVTSVSTKATRELADARMVYKYFKLKREVFTGYRKEKGYLIAGMEKAVVDYVYFVAIGKRELNDRLNLTKVDKGEIRRWVEMFNNQRLTNLMKELL